MALTQTQIDSLNEDKAAASEMIEKCQTRIRLINEILNDNYKDEYRTTLQAAKTTLDSDIASRVTGGRLTRPEPVVIGR